MPLHGIEQVQRARQIILVIPQRLSHALPHGFQAREVNTSAEPAVGNEDLLQSFLVQEVGLRVGRGGWEGESMKRRLSAIQVPNSILAQSIPSLQASSCPPSLPPSLPPSSHTLQNVILPPFPVNSPTRRKDSSHELTMLSTTTTSYPASRRRRTVWLPI